MKMSWKRRGVAFLAILWSIGAFEEAMQNMGVVIPDGWAILIHIIIGVCTINVVRDYDIVERQEKEVKVGGPKSGDAVQDRDGHG